ncbi:hypothetical protein U9M48_040654 [Paspalum notatum var. saurae]|uniref:Uncharacterized protein n=1 Tax=Paspalum notatum var. saurae TaxID=547442 RepID=A0AAQ3UR37_PASNO
MARRRRRNQRPRGQWGASGCPRIQQSKPEGGRIQQKETREGPWETTDGRSRAYEPTAGSDGRAVADDDRHAGGAGGAATMLSSLTNTSARYAAGDNGQVTGAGVPLDGGATLMALSLAKTSSRYAQRSAEVPMRARCGGGCVEALSCTLAPIAGERKTLQVAGAKAGWSSVQDAQSSVAFEAVPDGFLHRSGGPT